MSEAKNMTTIEFFDDESQDLACIIVRKCGDKISICISLRSDGDVETFLDVATTRRLIQALGDAVFV